MASPSEGCWRGLHTLKHKQHSDHGSSFICRWVEGIFFLWNTDDFFPWLVLAKVGGGVFYSLSRTVLWPWLVLTQVGGWGLFTWIVVLSQVHGGGLSLSCRKSNLRIWIAGQLDKGLIQQFNRLGIRSTINLQMPGEHASCVYSSKFWGKWYGLAECLIFHSYLAGVGGRERGTWAIALHITTLPGSVPSPWPV